MNYFSYLLCPRCKGDLVSLQFQLSCQKCGRKYPIKEGIPIFNDFLSSQDFLSINYFGKSQNMTEAEYFLEEWHKSFLRRFKENFPLVKNKVILDGGVGQGYMTIELAKQGATLIACDIVFEALVRLKKIAEQKGLKNILFVCCSLENLPIKDECVDFLLMNAVLEHLAKEEEAIRETGRVCKKHSGLMITVPLNYRYLNPLFIPSSIWQDRMIGHLRRYEEKNLSNKFKKYCFKVKNIYYSGHFKKVIFTKFFLPLFRSNNLLKRVEAIDRQDEKIKYGASNVCILFQRNK